MHSTTLSTENNNTNIARNPRALPRHLRPIAKAGEDGLDLALDDSERWWAVTPVTRTKHVVRFRHESLHHLIHAVSPGLARRWDAGELDELDVLRIEQWLSSVARQREAD